MDVDEMYTDDTKDRQTIDHENGTSQKLAYTLLQMLKIPAH